DPRDSKVDIGQTEEHSNSGKEWMGEDKKRHGMYFSQPNIKGLRSPKFVLVLTANSPEVRMV
ncbi:MAG: hypothetical protein ACC644_04160, partial [Candidatus Hydrothermarchaeales archaeon]